MAQQRAKQQAAQLKPQPPRAVVHRKLPRIDWLFVVSMIGVVGISMFLLLIEREKQSFLTLRQQEEDRLRVVFEQTAVSPNDVALLNQAFLDEDGVIRFIQTLEQVRGSFETFDLSFKSDEPEGDGLTYLPFSISLSGNYMSVLRFIEALFQAPYVIELQEFSLESNDGFDTHASLLLTGKLYVEE